MDAAFDKFLVVSELLRDDLMQLLTSESNSQSWRRNFIRVSASLLEGYASCFREMCAVSFDCLAPSVNQKEEMVLRSEGKCGASDRLKLTLNATYKIFELQPAPSFDGADWRHAQSFFEKRNRLMHPKNPADLHVSDDLWKEVFGGFSWLCEQLFGFVVALENKHSGR